MVFILISTDGHRLSDYAIGPEAKLNLVVRQTGEKTGALGVGSSSSTRERVWQILSTILARHFSPADSSKVLEHLIKVFQCSAQQHPSIHQIEAIPGKMRGREHTGKLSRSLQGQYKQATSQHLMLKLHVILKCIFPSSRIMSVQFNNLALMTLNAWQEGCFIQMATLHTWTRSVVLKHSLSNYS